MKILITGAGGQLGQDCLEVLGRAYTVHGRNSQQLDITRFDRVQHEMKRLQPDAVVNCAAYTAVDTCESEEEACRAVNTLGAAHLAEACSAAGARLIHISTDYVFAGDRPIPEPYTELDSVSPLSVYGRTKLAGELAIAERMDNFLILRTSWLYGIGGHNFLKTMLRLATADPERTLRVVDDQYGSLTWTMTLARQIERLLAEEVTGIADATAEGYCTWYEGARYFLESLGITFSLTPCTTADYPTPAHRPANSILENSFLKRNNLNMMQDWRQDIDAFVEQYKEKMLSHSAGV